MDIFEDFVFDLQMISLHVFKKSMLVQGANGKVG